MPSPIFLVIFSGTVYQEVTILFSLTRWTETSQVTYVTMVPPNGERDTAFPRGRYGERPQRDSCLKIHM